MRIYVGSSISTLFFDVVLKTEHTSTLTITEHPIENGSVITDHFRVEPSEVSIEFGASDVGSYNGHSVSAFQSLLSLQASGNPLTIATRLKTYHNMLIDSISAPDDYTTMHAVKAMVMFREIQRVSTATVGVAGRSSSPQKTGKTNGGTKQASSPSNSGNSGNQSILAGLKNKAGALLK